MKQAALFFIGVMVAATLAQAGPLAPAFSPDSLPYPQFWLSGPAAENMKNSDSVRVDIDVISQYNFNSPVTMALDTIVPPEPTITISAFHPNPVTPPRNGSATTTVWLKTSGTPQGAYGVYFKGTGDTITRHKRVEVRVTRDSSDSLVEGRDRYGYYGYDNTDLPFVNRPAYSWVELNPARGGLPGAQPVGAGGDNVTFPLAVPSGLHLRGYGTSAGILSVCSNGFLSLGSTTAAPAANTGIPSTTLPALPTLCPFWGDLTTASATGATWWYLADTANKRFIVEWDSVPFVGNLNSRATFEVILYDTSLTSGTALTCDSDILIQYRVLGSTANVTVGQQSGAQTAGLQSLYNGVLDIGVVPLVADRAMKFTTDAPRMANGVAQNPGVGPSLLSPAALGPAVPSPASGSVGIFYYLPRAVSVTLKVYNLSGQLLRTLARGEMEAGSHHVVWDGCNDARARVPSGVYFYRLEAGSFSAAQRVVITK